MKGTVTIPLEDYEKLVEDAASVKRTDEDKLILMIDPRNTKMFNIFIKTNFELHATNIGSIARDLKPIGRGRDFEIILRSNPDKV